jgi:PAS domain S-box-containing protein
MGERGRIILLAVIMALIVIVTSGVALGILYQTAFKQQRIALVQMAQSHARLIESVAGFDQKFSKLDHPEGAVAATLQQIKDAHKKYPGMGSTGEFILVRYEGNRIEFLLGQRHLDFNVPKPIPFEAVNAEAMRRALSGKSGSVIGLDYRGQDVLAAYEPVAITNWGIVAKIDIREIREPFIAAGIKVGIVALIVTIAGTGLFMRISNPLIHQIVKEKERAERYLHIAEAIIVILDNEGKVRRINRRGCDVLGYAEDEIIGKNWIETVIPQELREAIYEVHSQVISGELEPVEYFENEILTSNGEERTITWHNSYYRDDNNNIIGSLSSGQDITERKQGEVALLKAKKEADHANSVKSELLTNMSHELRTPLNAIIGFSSSIKEEVYGPLNNEKYSEYLDDILSSGRHLLDLINDILDISALEANAMEIHEANVDLNELVNASLHMVTSLAAAEKVMIAYDADDSSPIVLVDERRLKQVLLNLLGNAIKFTPQKGKVSVSTQVNVDCSLAIIVADTGIGMDAQELKKALSKFGQVDSGLNRAHEGTGLGLPLSDELMKMHGGAMDVISDKGHGTTITITLPKERIVQDTLNQGT